MADQCANQLEVVFRSLTNPNAVEQVQDEEQPEQNTEQQDEETMRLSDRLKRLRGPFKMNCHERQRGTMEESLHFLLQMTRTLL